MFQLIVPIPYKLYWYWHMHAIWKSFLYWSSFTLLFFIRTQTTYDIVGMVSNTYAVILSVSQCDIEYICMNLKKENEFEVRTVFSFLIEGKLS